MIKRLMPFLLGMVVMMLAPGCTDKGGELDSGFVNVEEIVLGSAQGSVAYFTVTTNSLWEIERDADWIDVNVMRGDGSQTVCVSSRYENIESEPREGTIRVSGVGKKPVTIKVIQQGGGMSNESFNVSPTDIVMDSNANATANLNITTSKEWSLVIEDSSNSWLSVSTSQGYGNSEVRLWTNYSNYDTKSRSVRITVTSGGSRRYVTVVQKGYSSSDDELFVGTGSLIVLAESIGFSLRCSDDVKYVKYGLFNGSKEDYSLADDEMEDASSLSEYYISWSSLEPSTNYTLAMQGFDANYNAGTVYYQHIQTSALPTTYPWIQISNVSGLRENIYDPIQIQWTETPNSSVNYFYEYALSNENAEGLNAASDAYMAYLIKTEISSGNLQKLTGVQNWKTVLNVACDKIAIITWGLDKSGNFAPKMNRYYGERTGMTVTKKLPTKRCKSREQHGNAGMNHRDIKKRRFESLIMRR